VRGHYQLGRAYLKRLREPLAAEDQQRLIAKALSVEGEFVSRQGDYLEAKILFQESLTVRRELGDQEGIATSLNNLGILAAYQDDYLGAKPLFQESLTLKRELGDRRGMATSLSNLGAIATIQGDYLEAENFYQEGLLLYRELGHQGGIAHSLHNLGDNACEQQHYREARRFYYEGLKLYEGLKEQTGIAYTLSSIAVLFNTTAQPHASIKLFAATQALSEKIGLTFDPRIKAEREHNLKELKSNTAEALFEEHWQAGLTLSTAEAVALALAQLKTSESTTPPGK
jgi:tetratricopeptide (TPR) repeat protein